MKKSKKTKRQLLLEKRFAALATERKADVKVPAALAEEVFQTLGEINEADAPEELIPPVQEKIIELFEDERE